MKIKANETSIIGNWIFDGSDRFADENCKGIDWLIDNSLKKVAKDYSGWETLYIDTDDHRYWESIFLQGETYGGGPKSLILISKEAALKKYKF